MLKIWLLYNIVISTAIFGTGLSGATSLREYLLPLLTLPLLYYLGREFKRKARKRKLVNPAVFKSDIGNPISLTQVNDLQVNNAESGTPINSAISDDNRRLFLKLVGSTSLSIFFMAVLGKGSAKAAFFGSMPGPGTVGIKDSSGTPIDPAEKQSTDGYEISEVDDSTTPSYYGFVHKTGAWYITKEDSTGGYRYAKGASAFSTNWTDRTTLSYDYFDSVF